MSPGRSTDRRPYATRLARLRNPALVALLLIGLTAVAYLPALRGDFIWDDDDYVTKNATLRDLNGLGRIWSEFGATRQYYPLVYTSFWIENHVWGLRPAGYHIVNVLLHGLGAGLLWLALRRLEVPCAFLAAAVFALHPINVESVAWITERKNVLSGVFYFAAALAYLRWARIGATHADELPITNYQLQNNAAAANRFCNSSFVIRHSAFYALSLAFFICALLSKSVTCTLPAALLIVLWWKRGRLTRADFLATAPLFALGLILGLTTAWMENTNVGAGGPEWHRPYAIRLITAGQAFWFYLGKIVWPSRLIFVYPKWPIDPHSPTAFAAPFGVILLFAALWILRRPLGRGPLAAMSFFLVTIAPALGFFNVYYAIRYSPVADHFVYLACIGPITLIVATASQIRAAPVRKRRARPELGGSFSGASTARIGGSSLLPQLLSAAVLIVLGSLTWRQCQVYQNLESLWTDTVEKNPSAAIAQHGLGAVLQRRGQPAEAQQRYERAVAIEAPDSKTLFNLGTVLQQQGKLDEALARYEAALRLEPDYTKCLVNYGVLLASKGRLDEAIQAFTKAIKLDPDYALAHEDRARALKQLGRSEEAAAEFREAERLKAQSR